MILFAAICSLVIGMVLGSFFVSASYNRTIKYKADSGIDMVIDGVFYEIRFSDRNKTEGEVKKN